MVLELCVIIVLLIVYIFFISSKKKNNRKVITIENNKPVSIEKNFDNQNFLREESKIRKEIDLEKQDKLTDALLKKQEKQFKILDNAKREIENGNLEEGILTIEDITYNKGGIIFPGVS